MSIKLPLWQCIIIIRYLILCVNLEEFPGVTIVLGIWVNIISEHICGGVSIRLAFKPVERINSICFANIVGIVKTIKA